jgi:hypothetical protein
MPFTQNAALDLLFPDELIPQHVKDELPPEFHVRLYPRTFPPLPNPPPFLIIAALLFLIAFTFFLN